MGTGSSMYCMFMFHMFTPSKAKYKHVRLSNKQYLSYIWSLLATNHTLIYQLYYENTKKYSTSIKEILATHIGHQRF